MVKKIIIIKSGGYGYKKKSYGRKRSFRRYR